MSRAASPFAGRLYGVVRVTREWEMARSSFYYQLRIAAQPQRVLRRRGPKTECSDETLTGKIREVLAASPFYGEGHRKVWARSEEHTSELQSLRHLVCRLLLEKKKKRQRTQRSSRPKNTESTI